MSIEINKFKTDPNLKKKCSFDYRATDMSHTHFDTMAMTTSNMTSDAAVARKTMRSLSQQVLEAFNPEERGALRAIMPFFIQAQVAKHSKTPQRLIKKPGTIPGYFQSSLVTNGNLTLDHVMDVLGINEYPRTRTFNAIVKLVAPDLIIRAEKGKRGGNKRTPCQLELTFMGFICACQVHRNPRAKLVQRLAARCTEIVCTELVTRAVQEAREDALMKNSKILKFGMYTGQAYYTVWKEQPGYCKWVSELDPGTRAMEDFQNYVVNMTAGQALEQKKKRQNRVFLNADVLRVVHEFLPTQDEHGMIECAEYLLRVAEQDWLKYLGCSSHGYIIVNPTDLVQLRLVLTLSSTGVTVSGMTTDWYWDEARTILVGGRRDVFWPLGKKTVPQLIVEVMRDTHQHLGTWTCSLPLKIHPIPSLAELRSTVA